jgi:spore germination protein
MDKRIIVTLAALFLAGCSDQKILEEQGLVQAVSYDLAKKRHGSDIQPIHVGIAIPIMKGGSSSQKNLEAVARSSKEARSLLTSQTEWNLVSGQLRTALIGRDVAEQSIWKHLDTLEREPSVSQRVKLALVKQNAYDLMSSDFKTGSGTFSYLDKLLEKGVKNNVIPEVTLYKFARDYYEDGIDPVMPILVKKNSSIDSDGIALFRGDRYITSLKHSQGITFTILTDRIHTGQVNIEIPSSGKSQAEFAAMRIIKSYKKAKVVRTKTAERFTVHISIKLKGSVIEYLGKKDLSSEKDRVYLEAVMAKQIEKDMVKIAEKTKKYSTYSLGIGRYVKNSMTYKEWKNMDWRKIYPKTNVVFHVRIMIKDYGKIK